MNEILKFYKILKLIKICARTCDMTIRSYLGNQNSTLGSVVPLAYFLISHMWWEQSSFMNIILDAVADCSGQTLDFFYSQRLLFPSFLFFSSIIFALGLKEPSSVSAGLKPLMNWCLYAWECSVKVFTSFCESTIRRTEKKITPPVSLPPFCSPLALPFPLPSSCHT